MEEIRGVVSKYPYKLEDRHFRLLSNLWNYHYEKMSDERLFPNEKRVYYEWANMLYIFRKAQKKRSKITISGEENLDKIDIYQSENIDTLCLLINEQLQHCRHEDYMEVFNWEERSKVLPEFVTKWENRMDSVEYENWKTTTDKKYYIDEPYTEEEIRQILKYEKTQMESFDKVMRERLSYYLNMVVDAFKKDGIFKSDKKTISTTDACFLYDLLCMIGIWEDNEVSVNSEKYLKIKNEMNKLKNIDLHKDLRILIP